MSKSIANLLEKSEADVTRMISKLEASAGNSSEDARLLAENKHQIRAKVSQLGLDPDDTTGEELYHALLAKFENDCLRVNRALGIGEKSSFRARTNLAIGLIEQAARHQEVWVLKNTAAKALIKQQPPKRLMKQLHYRSADSLVKRESIAEIFLALPFFESKSWQRDFQAKIAKQNSTNFELRPVQLLNLSDGKWGTIAGAKIATISQAVGAVAVLPSKSAQLAPVLTLALMLAIQLEELVGEDVSKSLAYSNLSLAWWANTEHLLSMHGDRPVSLSIKDTSLNHLYGLNYDQRLNHHAQESFWQELLSRYEKYRENLPQELSNFSYNITQDINKNLMPVRDLAFEYSEV